MFKPDKSSTPLVRAEVGADKQFGAVMPPLYLSANYTFEGFDAPREYDYTRSGNPTRDALARTLNDLEGGAGAVVTSTGMSALLLLCHLLKADDLLLAPHDCYGGTHRLFTALQKQGRLNVAFIDQSNPDVLREAFSRNPKIILVETPSNPLLRVVDISEISGFAKANKTLVAVDNTFLSPVLQRPIELGADLVIHSTTKYLNGHSDIVGGAVVAKDPTIHEELVWWANCLGITGAPFDSYLTLRGMRTLYARMRQHEENAGVLAEILDQHPAVKKVYYPGLESHPTHAIAKKQQKGFGAILSFELAGDFKNVKAFVEGLSCFTLAESLGGVESLVCHPATMTHSGMALEARLKAGITDSLIRISAGIENPEDLVRDLEVNLDKLLNKASQKPPLKEAKVVSLQEHAGFKG